MCKLQTVSVGTGKCDQLDDTRQGFPEDAGYRGSEGLFLTRRIGEREELSSGKAEKLKRLRYVGG